MQLPRALVKFDSPIVIKKPGFIYIYLSYENESNNWVYFDDFNVNYTKSPVLQSNAYYAFGLQTADSWTRTDSRPNLFLYNAGSELNSTTGNFPWPYECTRPLAALYTALTPYNYSVNSPVNWNDPTGAVSTNCYNCRYTYDDVVYRDYGPPAGGRANVDFPWSGVDPLTYDPVGLKASAQAWSDMLQLAEMRQDAYSMSKSSYASKYGQYISMHRASSSGLLSFITGRDYVYNPWYGYVLADEVLSYSGDLSNQRFFLRLAAIQAKAPKTEWMSFFINDITLNPQTGGDPPGWFERNFKDISDSRYPGIKIYETSLIADGTAVTLPGFGILVHPYYKGESRTKVLQHEYGHFLDYMFSGDINRPSMPGSPNIPIVSFYLMLGVPSLFNAATGIGGDHEAYWTEIRANQWAEIWFGNGYIRDEKNYPTKSGGK